MLADWESIASPADAASLNVLRADPSHPLDFRIGRDARGRFAFQLEGSGDLPEVRADDAPAGMDVTMDEAGGGTGRLTLLLHDGEDLPIFRALCGDLLAATHELQPSEAVRAMRLLLGRLHQWQEVLARRRRGRLSRSEELGLFGELLFIRDALAPRTGLASAVTAWRGPYGDEQDFVIQGAVLEVKTHGMTSDARIMVSSEDQLDSSSVRVFLCRQCVAAAPAASGGESLDGLVAELVAATAEMPATNVRLRTGLEAAGWVKDAAYGETWVLGDRSWYDVADGFPRIVRSDLRPGVERVRYQIAVADCAPFLCDADTAFATDQS